MNDELRIILTKHMGDAILLISEDNRCEKNFTSIQIEKPDRK